MTELTIGQVAGALNFGLLFVQITLPLLQAFVLCGILHTSNSAVTWSVVGRFVHSTFLPTLLSADTAAERKHGVSNRVVAMIYMSFISVLLVAAAGVISPIGLGETITAGSLINATFEYAIDPTVFGQATERRENYTISRSCDNGYIPCPGVDPQSGAFRLDRGYGIEDTIYKATMPPNLTECFSSGTRTPSDLRSNPFEIQYRRYWNAKPDRNNNSYINTTGDYNFIQRLILDERYEVREGIVLDAIKGGLGFRNHTVPTHPLMRHGATWSETLLWIEPWSSCMATNWTFYTKRQITPFSFWGPQLTETEIKLRKDGSISSDINPQRNLSLESRLSQAVKLFEQNLLSFYNETVSNGTLEINADLELEGSNPDLLSEFTFSNGFGITLYFIQDEADLGYSDEFANVTKLLSSPLQSCINYTSKSTPSMHMPFIRCGYFLPSPTAVYKGQDTSNLDEVVAQPLSICATGLAASMREVRFRYNYTGDRPSLGGLDVIEAIPARYENTMEYPLWAVEKPQGNWTIEKIKLLWGIVDESTAERFGNKIQTVRGDYLLLPAYYDSQNSGTGWGDSLGAISGAGLALDITYSHSLSGTNSYDGSREFAMLLKLQNLSSSFDTLPLIPNLIWTEIAANMLVGSKSRLPPQNGDAAIGEVRMLERRITYKYQYGVLGFLCCGIWIFWVVFSIILLFIPVSRGRMRISSMKSFLNKLSVGRPLLLTAKPETDSYGLTTKEWLRQVGRSQIDLSDGNTLKAVTRETP